MLFHFINKKIITHIIYFVFVSLTFCFVNLSVAQSSEPSMKKKSGFTSQEDKELNKIKSLKVKSRTKYSAYYELSGKLPADKSIVTSEKFNRKGLLTELIEYNGVGNVIAEYKFEYNANGNPIKAIAKEVNNKSSIQTSKYDSKGNEIEKKIIQSGRKKFESKSIFKYDKDGNHIETEEYLNGKLVSRLINSYQNQQKVSSVVKDANEKIILTSSYLYNSNGKLSMQKRIEGGVELTASYKYDVKGNVEEMVDHEVKRFYSYDENGNILEHKMYLLDGRRQLRLMFKYSPNGLQNEIIRFDNFEKPVLYTNLVYKYYK
jgi:acyl-CoA-binding protein